MNLRRPSVCMISVGLLGLFGAAPSWAKEPLLAVEQLELFLSKAASERGALGDQEFAGIALSRDEASQAKRLLWADHLARLRVERKREVDDRAIELDGSRLRFTIQEFGEKPKSGWSLFISLHGGGGTAARVNDQQWRNQQRLYKLSEGLYVAPRAPTDTWNMWHRGHIDRLFARLIEDLVALRDVDPNRVYVLGYSAGGDGVYQLAPRMADHWAGAAMMAGHPNDASPLGLRNIAFALHMGGDDRAYKRNDVARQWKERLEKLREADPGGYLHQAVIHPGLGHWMQGKDAMAIPWMANHSRDPRPDRIVWKQSSVIHENFYWLHVERDVAKRGAEVRASRKGQSFEIDSSHVKSLTLLLDDRMADLDREIVVRSGDRDIYRGRVKRSIESLARSLARRGDREYMFSAKISLDLR